MNQNNNKNILVAIDRDGTLNYDDGYFGRKDTWKNDLKLYSGATELIKELNEFTDVIVITNQIGVARGYYGPERVEEINNYLDNLLKKQGAIINGWYYCPYVEREWGLKQGLDPKSPWLIDGFPKTRKPEIGMLQDAAQDLGRTLDSYQTIIIIGDALDDLNMALNAHGIGIWFDNGKNKNLKKQVEDLKKANPNKIFDTKDLRKVFEIIKSL